MRGMRGDCGLKILGGFPAELGGKRLLGRAEGKERPLRLGDQAEEARGKWDGR